jgi:ATP-binding cassette subfamily B protein
MVAKHYGKSFSLQNLRDKMQINREGVNLLGISEAAEAVGFRTVAARLSYEQLINEANLPAILHWNQNHFVVLYKAKKNKLYISDPAKTLLTYTKQEFLHHWISNKEDGSPEGIALLLEPTPAFYNTETDEDSKQSSGLAFKNIFQYLVPHKKLLMQLLFGLGIASLLQLFLPFLTQSIVDVGVSIRNIHFVYIVLLAQLALFAGRLAVEFVRSWILLHISTRINLSILTDFLIKLMKLPASFFDSKKTGDIMQRMNDHSRIENFLTGSSLNVLFSLVTLVIFSAVLATFNFAIFIVFMVAAFIYSIWVILFLKRRKTLDYKRFDVASKEQSATIQLVQGMQEIKLNGVEKEMRWGWERLQAKLFKLSITGLSLNQWQQAGAFFINEGKNIFITFLSATAVIEGKMTLGEMLSVQYIIGQLNSPIEQMIGFVQSWQTAKISIDRLNEIHYMEDEEPAHKYLLQELPPAFAKQLAGGKITNAGEPIYQQNQQHEQHAVPQAEVLQEIPSIYLSNISFTYPGAGNEPVLKDISLSIPKGKTTAIVGVSGSGKTTLLKLLLKFYEPQKGDIKLGATSLSTISHKTWRAHCGMVMQESFIFSDSIAKNIAVGQEKIDMDKLNHAVNVANVKNFIESLPLGYNTKIGAEGNGISMGQKQRILIARAVYRNPEFIFFDEATNSLDANNESVILQNLDQFLKGKTVVVVAHRLSTVKHADQIVVLNKGVISEKGTHQELINLKGEYYTLVKNQLELGE